MNPRPTNLIPVLLMVCIVCTACAPAASPSATAEARDILYQVSTLDALMSGSYDGIATAEEVLQKGDFGIGTFDGLDGEMVMLDGSIYQVKSSGAVEKVGGEISLPFTAVTFFDADATQTIHQATDLDTLKAALDQMIVKKDRFYAIRVDGVFSAVEVRSVPRQQKPYPVLSEVTKNQPVFHYTNTEGSLVGFWCPESVGSLNVPGYHLHFISDDRSQGGHLLSLSLASAELSVDETRFFEMELGENAPQAGAIGDAQEEIDKVEK